MSDTDQMDLLDSHQLETLKIQARQLGIMHSNNISAATLAQKIKDHLDGKKPLDDTVVASPQQEKQNLRKYLKDENMKLVRLRITNLDPKKKDLAGEIITVANEYIGVVRKYVPYGEQTDDGWHVPHCIYMYLKDKEFLDIRPGKDNKGVPQNIERMVREFALEVMTPLTREQLDNLAISQAAEGAVD